jgi:hypothetical protein
MYFILSKTVLLEKKSHKNTMYPNTHTLIHATKKWKIDETMNEPEKKNGTGGEAKNTIQITKKKDDTNTRGTHKT